MDNHVCRLKCAAKLTNEQLQKIFEGFWALETWSHQNSYICGLVKQRNVARRYSEKGRESRRTYTRDFYLTSNEGSVRVCKAMFLATLDISIDHQPSPRIVQFHSSHRGATHILRYSSLHYYCTPPPKVLHAYSCSYCVL